MKLKPITMSKLYMVLVLLIFAACTTTSDKPEGFTLTGDISDLDVTEIQFMYHGVDGEHKDTLMVTEGKFKAEGVVAEPQFVMLLSPEARLQKVFYIENADMKITGVKDSLDVTGSDIQDTYEVLENRITAHRANAMKIYEKAQSALTAGDSVNAMAYQSEFDSLYRAEPHIRKQFVLDYPDNFAVLNELLNWINESNLTEAHAIYDQKVSAHLKSTKMGQQVAERMDNLERVMVGKMAPLFSQQDLSGNEVGLSDYKGTYVLLEFWASWCGPCRAENPNLRAEYMKYKDKGFDILGISLDDKKDRWVKALKEDDLPWTQVSDLEGWSNEAATQYGIRAIPANFLINPEGQIVAKDLRGEDLNNKLSELFD